MSTETVQNTTELVQQEETTAFKVKDDKAGSSSSLGEKSVDTQNSIENPTEEQVTTAPETTAALHEATVTEKATDLPSEDTTTHQQPPTEEAVTTKEATVEGTTESAHEETLNKKRTCPETTEATTTETVAEEVHPSENAEEPEVTKKVKAAEE